MSVLHYAVSTDVANEALVRFFLSSGFQPSDADKQGRTAPHYASVARNSGIIKCLLEVGFKESKPPVNDLQRAFVEAVKADRLDLVNYLVDYGVDMHFVSFRGWNVLHEAAAAGAGVNLIEFLLEKGVNAQLADKFGITPLMEACRHGHNDILVCLLGAGGKFGDVDLAGQSALHLAAQGNHKNVVQLLLKNEANIHVCDQRGWTPLHSAAVAGKNCEIIDLLFANDAKFDAKTLSRQTAEDLAMCVGHADAASYLKRIHASNATKSGVPGYSDDSWSGTPIALKVGKLNSNNFGEALETWSQLNHPHIERIYNDCYPNDAKQKPHFVFERTSCGELYGYLDSDKADTIDGIWEKMYQVALGLEHLHDRNMIRGPLSSYDIFIALNGVTKLNLIDQDARDHVPWCTAPEVLAGLPASFKSDIFAFGFIIIDAIKRGARIWCPSYDDDAILSGKLIKKPDTMSQWKLVERVCCYNFASVFPSQMSFMNWKV